SVAVLVDSDWLAFWGNPCIPAVLTSLVASVVVTLLTPASSMSREQALEMITRERESRPTPPPLPIGKRHTSRG
ncbi:sodium:proline symporter, partial [Klebsiella pneumoniae]